MQPYLIPNLKNACRVLKHLAQEPQGETMRPLSETLEIPRTTLLRILTTLESEGLVGRKEKNYVLGNQLIHLGLRAMDNLELKEVARPILRELSEITRETSHLAVLSGQKTLIVDVYTSPNPVSATSQPGSLAAVHCSSTGKVFLAYLLRDQVEDHFEFPLEARTGKTITTAAALKRDIEQTLKQGYGLDDEEYNPGVRCLAAPVRNAYGEVIAAIGITGGTASFTAKKVPSVAAHVIQSAENISRLLGVPRAG